ncbi:MAG: hypothetical protein EXQ58_03090 [Acidobacteria bacterium]|nr:hypothetical protein [Acidobacteriota bacterium]
MTAKKIHRPTGRKQLPPGIYYRSGRFRIRYFDDKQIQSSETFPTRDLAKQALAVRHTDVARKMLGFLTDKDSPTFRGFAEVYKETHVRVHSQFDRWQRKERYRFDKLVSGFGDYCLSALTPSVVDEYIRDESDRDRTLEGIN